MGLHIISDLKSFCGKCTQIFIHVMAKLRINDLQCVNRMDKSHNQVKNGYRVYTYSKGTSLMSDQETNQETAQTRQNE